MVHVVLTHGSASVSRQPTGGRLSYFGEWRQRAVCRADVAVAGGLTPYAASRISYKRADDSEYIRTRGERRLLARTTLRSDRCRPAYFAERALRKRLMHSLIAGISGTRLYFEII